MIAFNYIKYWNHGNGTRIDISLATALFILAPIPILYLLSANNYYTFFYQFFIPESIVWACGEGFLLPASPISALNNFTTGLTSTFDCSQLNGSELINQSGFYYKTQPYLTWIVAIFWRLFGVSYQSLMPIVYLLYGAYISGIYLICRQFLHPIFSTLVALFIALSPLSAYMVVELRDFSKAPFFIWSFLFLLRAAREGKDGVKAILTILASSVIAIGYGFRSDLIVMVVFGFIFLLIFALLNLRSNKDKRCIVHFYPLPVFVITFMIGAFPVWSGNQFSGYSGTFIMQGMSEPFRIEGNITKANYANGWMYSDELTLSSVAAALSKGNSNWNESESQAIPGVSTSLSFQKSTYYMRNWVDIFIGDFFTQSIKSAGWIVSFPIFFMRIHPMPTPQWKGVVSDSPFFNKGLKIYGVLSGEQYLYIGVIGLISLIFLSYLRSPPEAISLIIFIGLLISYPGLQFSLRHIFHLEFIWLLCFFSIFSAAIRIAGNFKKLLSVMAIFISVILFIGSIYSLALIYQDKVLALEVNRLLSLPRVPINANKESRGDGNTFYKIPIPNKYQKITTGGADSMTPQMYSKGVQWDVRAGADRILITLDGQNCKLDQIKVYGEYIHTVDVWQPLDIMMSLNDGGEAKGVINVLLPAFYRGTQYFGGVVIPHELDSCLVGIERIDGESVLPIFFTAFFQDKRIIGGAHKKIGTFQKYVNNSSSANRYTSNK